MLSWRRHARKSPFGEWRSLVARQFWELDVAGSNPVSPTTRASSSAGQSNGLLSRGSRVRVLPGAPLFSGNRGVQFPVDNLPRPWLKFASFVVGVAQLVEHWIVAPVVAGSIPVTHPINIPGLPFPRQPLRMWRLPRESRALIVCRRPIRSAGVVELVDTLDLGSSAVRCGSSSLPTRTILNSK